MKPIHVLNRSCGLTACLVLPLLATVMLYAANDPAPSDQPAFKPEELVQMLAPIALYPDELLSQMLMAATYPLEIVQADRWVKQNPNLTGAALTQALESQSWDPSVKSLVNFPQVLAMMSDKLDLTVKLGDAFMGQQKQVLDTIQQLRVRAQQAGNLQNTAQQSVVVEQQGENPVIVIAPANPQVVYVPSYSPTVIYGAWPYPAYPPAPYYPPGYVAGNALAFGVGVAVGAAWGYAWGHCDWNRGNVDIDVNRNLRVNANINRNFYQAQYQNHNLIYQNGRGAFQHDPYHRQGVPYRTPQVSAQYGRYTSADAAQAREAYRGRVDAGGQYQNRGSENQARPAGTGAGYANRPVQSYNPGAFDGVNRGGAAVRSESNRGSVSRSAPARSGGGARGGRR